MRRIELICCGIVLLLGLTVKVDGQDLKKLQREQDSIYQVNIKKSRIAGVYIPKSFDDAFSEIDKLSSPEVRHKFRLAEEEVVAKKLHFGLGKWMLVNWNFETGSRLSHKMRQLGIVYPDDMVNFMLRSYHRYLNKKDQNYQERAKEYIKKRKEERERKLNKVK